MTLNITDAKLHEWAKMRADDAGRLARELVACRRQSQAAVAAAYEAAAQVVLGSNLGLDISDIADDVRALATPDQIAALTAERAATVTVNPLVWECVSWESGDGVKGENDDTWEAETPFNDTPFVIEWRGADKFVLTMPNGETHYSGSLEAAKAKFQTIHEAAIRSAITITSGVTPDTIPLPRAEVEALMEAAEITLAAIMRLQDEWGDYDPQGVHWNRITAFAATYAEGDEHDAVRMRKALATLQERMK